MALFILIDAPPPFLVRVLFRTQKIIFSAFKIPN